MILRRQRSSVCTSVYGSSRAVPQRSLILYALSFLGRGEVEYRLSSSLLVLIKSSGMMAGSNQEDQNSADS